MKKTWKDVDWVELGCRGWDIDETGAGIADPVEDLWVDDTRGSRIRVSDQYGNAVKGAKITAQRTETCEGERGHAHLDWSSLDLILQGPPEFVERVTHDLRCAGVLAPYWTVTTGATGGTLTGSSTLITYAA